MPNHPNRSSQSNPAANPTPAEIRTTRELAGLTPEQAAAIVHVNARSWQKWEYGERRMHPALWELFRIKSAK